MPEEKSVPDFQLICQELTNWCWAAVTQSILHANASPSAQRDVAIEHIKTHRPNEGQWVDTATQSGACNDAQCVAQFNAPHSLRRILTERNLLRANGVIRQGLTFDKVREEIDTNRPIPCRIEWQAGIGAHFVCVAGYAVNGSDQFVHVFDPLLPGVRAGEASRSSMRFDTFLDSYPLGTLVGRLTHAYLT